MNIKCEYNVDLNVVLDETHTISHGVAKKFFNEFSIDTILSYASELDDILDMDWSSWSAYYEQGNLDEVFKYFLDNKILKNLGSDIHTMFEILDIDRFRTDITELYHITLDLNENHIVYKRDFIIDKVLDI
jgi:hypothetical protein